MICSFRHPTVISTISRTLLLNILVSTISPAAILFIVMPSKKTIRVLCDGTLVQQSQLGAESVQPYIYIRTMASTNTIIKSGELCDKLAKIEDIIGFKMEGTRVWDNLPYIFIKGVCNYIDGHKNKV
jgi:nucleoside phosphorylase